jgi:hypothetical protein
MNKKLEKLNLQYVQTDKGIVIGYTDEQGCRTIIKTKKLTTKLYNTLCKTVSLKG